MILKNNSGGKITLNKDNFPSISINNDESLDINYFQYFNFKDTIDNYINDGKIEILTGSSSLRKLTQKMDESSVLADDDFEETVFEEN